MGCKINNTNYALVTLDGGLSIVNTDNPSSPSETVHINHEDYHTFNSKLGIPDVETFVYNGITYAFLATNKKNDVAPLEPFPLVMIINLNEALEQASQNPPPPYEILIDPYNPSGDVYVGKIDDFGEIKQSHTLTIDGDYLYVATLNDSLPVWDLGSSPTSPQYKGFITINPSDAIHEMYVESTGSASSKVYASALRGGLHVIDLNLQNMSFTVTTQLYDSDKKYANLVNSTDPLFNFRFTHSAWPNADGSYIFTTDELAIFTSDNCNVNLNSDINLYLPGPYVLRDAHRHGAFLRTWKTSQL
ncbi:MAG: hypothetical protein IH852_12690 [Bacteroidetes bacterium]|nr:hypothetical protein [Bacteroidota bacterium]